MTVFLPCRAGSERVPNKNTKNFAGIEGGLLSIKLQTLLKTKGIDSIVVSTDDEKVMDIVDSLATAKIKIDRRPAHLASSSTSTDELINYVPEIIEDEHILWTHVTSPFLKEQTFEEAIDIYTHSSKYDSLMTVNKIQGFIWGQDGPINYNRTLEKWPRTQTLKELYEINSAIFINSRTSYLKHKDRIGDRPYLMPLDKVEAIDIDWPKDFVLAEKIFKER